MNNDKSEPSTSYDKVGSVIWGNQICDPVSPFSNKVNAPENQYSELIQKQQISHHHICLQMNTTTKKKARNMQNYDYLTNSSNSSENAVPT